VNLIDLNRRHAVITSGAQGLGFAIAERLVASVSLSQMKEESNS